ncbi:unnamed protein product [Brassicogethes aeneus]|uniref:SCP domain-containing protein n=1 Tax=Brassicogethes aeneus TaxID=1431903 RepID=A0A9P0B5Z1_BRAAE|nr:unnamed protein product [Brassicogethes aeneus]
MYAGNGRISAKLIKKAMASWYSEIKDMEPDIYTKYDDPASGKAIGHFTQLVWAKSEFIGCAASTDGKKLYFGCNYGPAGNVKGAGILKWGTPCTECENSLKCNQKYESLCGVLLPIPDSSPMPFKNKFYFCFIFVVINLFI